MNVYQILSQIKHYLSICKHEKIRSNQFVQATKECSALLAYLSLQLETQSETQKKCQLFFCLSNPFFKKNKDHVLNNSPLKTNNINFLLAALLNTFSLFFLPLYPYFKSYLFLNVSTRLLISKKSQFTALKKQKMNFSITTQQKHLDSLDTLIGLKDHDIIMDASPSATSKSKAIYIKKELLNANLKRLSLNKQLEDHFWFCGPLENAPKYELDLKLLLNDKNAYPFLFEKVCFEIHLSKPLTKQSMHHLNSLLFLFKSKGLPLYLKTSNVFLTTYTLLLVTHLKVKNTIFSFDYLYPNSLAFALELLEQKTLIHSTYEPKSKHGFDTNGLSQQLILKKSKELNESALSLKPLFSKHIGSSLWHQLCHYYLLEKASQSVFSENIF